MDPKDIEILDLIDSDPSVVDELDDDQLVRLDLTKIRVDGRGELMVAIRLPEQVDAGLVFAVLIGDVATRDGVRRERELRILVLRDLDAMEVA